MVNREAQLKAIDDAVKEARAFADAAAHTASQSHNLPPDDPRRQVQVAASMAETAQSMAEYARSQALIFGAYVAELDRDRAEKQKEPDSPAFQILKKHLPEAMAVDVPKPKVEDMPYGTRVVYKSKAARKIFVKDKGQEEWFSHFDSETDRAVTIDADIVQELVKNGAKIYMPGEPIPDEKPEIKLPRVWRRHQEVLIQSGKDYRLLQIATNQRGLPEMKLLLITSPSDDMIELLPNTSPLWP